MNNKKLDIAAIEESITIFRDVTLKCVNSEGYVLMVGDDLKMILDDCERCIAAVRAEQATADSRIEMMGEVIRVVVNNLYDAKAESAKLKKAAEKLAQFSDCPSQKIATECRGPLSVIKCATCRFKWATEETD